MLVVRLRQQSVLLPTLCFTSYSVFYFLLCALLLPNGERIPLESLGQDLDAVDIDLDIDVGDFIDNGELSLDDADEVSDAAKADAAPADATADEPDGSATDNANEKSPE